MPTETTDKPKANDVQTGPQPKASTPLPQPVVRYNKIWRVPALVVETQEELDALDPNEWIADPASGGATKEKPPEPHWPKLYANINVPPVVVGSAAEAAALGSAYREFAISDELAKSAEATVADAANAAKQKPPQATPQQQHK